MSERAWPRVNECAGVCVRGGLYECVPFGNMRKEGRRGGSKGSLGVKSGVGVNDLAGAG